MCFLISTDNFFSEKNALRWRCDIELESKKLREFMIYLSIVWGVSNFMRYSELIESNRRNV